MFSSIESVRYCAEIYASKQVPYHPNVLNVLEYFLYVRPIQLHLKLIGN